jgi:short-subunit dehydrogenase
LILHGRNPNKLDALAELLRARHPTIDIRVTVQDTSHPTSFPHLFAHNLINILGPITLLINNVANYHSAVPFCRLTEDEISTSLATNIAFPTLLSNHLLSSPVRRRPSETGLFPPTPDENTGLLAAKNGDVQWELRCIINMSCIAGLHATEYSSVHAATKAYLTQLSRGIITDAPEKVEVLNLLIGHTRTSSWRGKSSVLVQDVQACVCNCLAAVGLGKTTGRDRAWWCYDLLGLGATGGRGEGVYVYPIHELWIGMERLLPGRMAYFLSEYYGSLFGRDDTI